MKISMYVCVKADSESALMSFVSDKFGMGVKVLSSDGLFAFITPPAKIKDIKASLADIPADIQNTLMVL